MYAGITGLGDAGVVGVLEGLGAFDEVGGVCVWGGDMHVRVLCVRVCLVYVCLLRGV